MRRHPLIPIFLACLLAPWFANALTVDGNYHALDSEFEYLADPAGKLTIGELLSPSSQHQFTSARDSRPDNIFEPVWLKLELEFSEQVLPRRYLLFGRLENLYDIRLYRPDGQGAYEEWVTGNNYPVSSREIDALRYGFSIQPDAEPVTLYMRYVGGPGTDNLPWDLVEEQTYLKGSQTYYFIGLACLSGIGALLIFNLVIALSLRRLDYLYYSAYVFSVMMALITLDGAGFYFLWPDSPDINARALHSFNLLSAALRLLVIISFLDIIRVAPGWHRASQGVLALLAISLVAVIAVGVTNLPPYTTTISWAIGILFGFAVCVYAITQRVKLAWPLLITLLVPSITAVLQGVLIVQSQQIGVLEMQLAKMGFALHVVMFSLCLAAHIKLETESHQVALHDSLTGLPGKTLLQDQFEWAAQLSRRQEWNMAVLFIDLDGFKAVNDSMGHAAGDKLLVQVAARMQGLLRRADFVARMGGDEFVVLLVGLEESDSAGPVADKLVKTLAAPYRIDNREVRISASIGVALFPAEGEELPALLEAADTAMYSAKRQGKNSYSLSDASPASQPG